MLRSANALKEYSLGAKDGHIGAVKEFYFDDQKWTVRYLVAQTGNWLLDRRVLLSPYALRGANEVDKVLPVDLTKEQIEKSPLWASDKPVSRQFEYAYYQYYRWPMYWYGPYSWGASGLPLPGPLVDPPPPSKDEAADPHLRSTIEVSGYHLHAKEEKIGHVEDFIIDDESWAIRYVVIDTANWWPGRKVLIAPQWIEQIDEARSIVSAGVLRNAVKNAHAYKHDVPITREYEAELYRHYKRQGYWTASPAQHGHRRPA